MSKREVKLQNRKDQEWKERKDYYKPIILNEEYGYRFYLMFSKYYKNIMK